MARLRGPLLSHAAHGTLGRALTFSTRRSCNHVRFQHGQKDFVSSARAPVRAAYQLGIELWSYLPPAEKAYWVEVEKRGYADV